MSTIDRKEWNLAVYHSQQFVDSVKYILKDIFIGIVKEPKCDQGESQ
jgi:HEPN domain-containing protein